MTYQQVRDVVMQMRKTHQQLRNALEQHQGNGTEHDDRARLIFQSLRNEENQLQRALAQYGRNAQEELLNTWLQYIPDEEVRAKLALLEMTPDISVDAVVERKLEFDRAMIDFLRQLAIQTAVPRVEEFFRSLLVDAESRVEHLAWKLQDYYGDGTPRPPEH